MYRPISHPSRYAERDHEQLVELRVQRDQLEQKLLVEQGRDDGVEHEQGRDDVGLAAPVVGALRIPNRRCG